MAKNKANKCRHFRSRVLKLGLLAGFSMVLTVHPGGLCGQGLSSLSDRLKNASKPAAPGTAPASTSPNSAADDSGVTPAFGSAPIDLDMLLPLFAEPKSVDTDSKINLQREAERSFLAGDQAVALKLMFGHMAANYESAQELIQSVKYSKLLRRPVWSIQFGVSMWVRDGGVEPGDANPIPMESQAGGRPTLGDQRTPSSSGSPRASNSTPSNALADAFRSGGNRRNQRTRNSGANQNRSVGGLQPLGSTAANDDAAPNQLGNDTAGNAEASRDIDETLGLVAQVIGEEFTSRYNQGDFGPLLVNVNESETAEQKPATTSPALTPPATQPIAANPLTRLGGGLPRLGSGQPRPTPPATQPVAANTLPRLGGGLQPLSSGQPPSPTRPAANVTANSTDAAAVTVAVAESTVLSSADSLPMWKPGIVFVGSGSSSEMIKQARTADIDVLIHFEVVLKPGRNDEVQNIAKCRLFKVATGEPLGTSKSMDNNAEQQAASNGSGGRQYVMERIANLLMIMDRDLKVVNLPKLTPEIARRRVGSLLGNGPEKSLRTLAEIRLYQLQQLLTPAEVELAFDIVGGTDTLMLLHGNSEQRTAIAQAWAVESNTKSGS